VFDSIYDSLSPDLPVQLAMIYQPMAKDNVLEVKILPSQHQTGSTDCGLFAIAWAAELSSGNRPEDVMLDQTRMRVHFLECLNRGRIDRFPQTHIAKRKWENELPVIKLKLEEIEVTRTVKTVKMYCDRDYSYRFNKRLSCKLQNKVLTKYIVAINF
jgi:hypothetical protein